MLYVQCFIVDCLNYVAITVVYHGQELTFNYARGQYFYYQEDWLVLVKELQSFLYIGKFRDQNSCPVSGKVAPSCPMVLVSST